jgi:hypothetical protein
MTKDKHLVDSCIRAEVEILNRLGIRTTNSCCGHKWYFKRVKKKKKNTNSYIQIKGWPNETTKQEIIYKLIKIYGNIDIDDYHRVHDNYIIVKPVSKCICDEPPQYLIKE